MNLRRQLSSLIQFDSGLRSTGSASDLYNFVNGLTILRPEVLYVADISYKLDNYVVMTNDIKNAKKSAKKLRAFMFSVKTEKTIKLGDSKTMNKTVNTQNADIYVLSATEVIVKQGLLSMDLLSSGFKSDFKAYIETNRANDIKSKSNVQKPKERSFWSKALNVVGIGVLVGLGYKLLKRYVIGNECVEMWQKPDSEIAMESNVSQIQRRTFISTNPNQL